MNNTDEILDSVTAGSGGFQTLDDDIITVGGPKYSYEAVKPNEAVQVESYHSFYDSDYVLQLIVEIKSKRWGTKEFSTTAKGGFSREVLLWDNGDPGEGKW